MHRPARPPTPTIAELAAEQGVTPFDPATFAFDPPLTDAERDGLLAALAELRGEYGGVEWAVRYDGGAVRVKDDREHAEDCARIVSLSYGTGTAAQVVYRRIGPWMPVDEEEHTDG